MASWEEIQQKIRRRAQAMREFARYWGATPFFGHGRDGTPIVVSRELNPALGEGRWRNDVLFL